MSMKRSKQVNRRNEKDVDGEGFGFGKPKAAAEPTWDWQENVASQPEERFVPYAMSRVFEKGNLLVHPTFGKGVVTLVEGKRIVVLFQDGLKKLGHGAA
ncbi:MAG TPA: hypothetical protein PK668_12355 [Myxococcota bacterium]|nr:hypothetical protein [Myxococcota bacterium]HRY93739.1 hypothetical protein [Myxococcota bacterium]HSA22998.1 hypothetical protein [Myxococcota bacterium]